jgi:large subunit ribosomal protein L6
MSRIGKKPIDVPAGVTVTVEGRNVTVKGPRGTLTRSLPPIVAVKVDGAVVNVTRPNDETASKAMHGLTRTLVANMVDGVTKGFQKNLDIVGVGYKAENKPWGLLMSLGYSHQIEVKAPEGIKLNAPTPTSIVVDGANKEVVGQIAAEIRSLRPPEPYKGKGVKYQGEVVRRKAGKAGGK